MDQPGCQTGPSLYPTLWFNIFPTDGLNKNLQLRQSSHSKQCIKTKAVHSHFISFVNLVILTWGSTGLGSFSGLPLGYPNDKTKINPLCKHLHSILSVIIMSN